MIATPNSKTTNEPKLLLRFIPIVPDRLHREMPGKR